MAMSTKRSQDLAAVGRALRGPLTAEKRRAAEKGISNAVKTAVEKTVNRNRRALRELAGH
jgi:hypothetical protein